MDRKTLNRIAKAARSEDPDLVNEERERLKFKETTDDFWAKVEFRACNGFFDYSQEFDKIEISHYVYLQAVSNGLQAEREAYVVKVSW